MMGSFGSDFPALEGGIPVTASTSTPMPLVCPHCGVLVPPPEPDSAPGEQGLCPSCHRPLAVKAADKYRARMREASVRLAAGERPAQARHAQTDAFAVPHARIPRFEPSQPSVSASKAPAQRRHEAHAQDAAKRGSADTLGETAVMGASRPLPPRQNPSVSVSEAVRAARPASQAVQPYPSPYPAPHRESLVDSFNWIRLLVVALACVAVLTSAVYFFLRVTDQGQVLLASWHMEATAEAYAALGRRRMQEGAILEGIAALEIAQSKEPNDLRILMDLGAAYEANNQIDRAELAYRRAIQYFETYPEPYRRLTTLFLDAGREAEALQCMLYAFEKTKDEAFQDMLAVTRPAYPRATPLGGTYSTETEVTLVAAEGAEIRYTLDNTDPVHGTLYTGPVLIPEGGWTLRAVTLVGGMVSEEQKQAYAIRKPIPDMPKESLAIGTYSSVRTVGLRGEPGTTLYYTTDGSEATVDSKKYDGTPIQLRVGKTTLRAIAVNSLGKVSNELNLLYQCEGKTKASFAEKDTFDGLTLFTTTREAFVKKYGEPLRENPGTPDVLGAYTVLEYPFGNALFLQKSNSAASVLAELSTTDPEMKGPRGVHVGMDLAEAVDLFRNEGGEDDGHGNRILYNLKGNVSDGNMALLHQTGERTHEVHYYAKLSKDYIEFALYSQDGIITKIEWLRYRVTQ
jgi:tetratricopeptide (TPR) repeat protein